jgi:hypothetical protein
VEKRSLTSRTAKKTAEKIGCVQRISILRGRLNWRPLSSALRLFDKAGAELERPLRRSLPGFAEGVLGDSTHKSSQIFDNLAVGF